MYDLTNTASEPTVFDLGYKLGPRINAGGRVSKSSYGPELLISNDPEKVFKIATNLDKSNKERQAIELLLSLNRLIKKSKRYHNQPILCSCQVRNWHEGVMGIVASRIKEKYNKPTVIISLKNNIGKGSARSSCRF